MEKGNHSSRRVYSISVVCTLSFCPAFSLYATEAADLLPQLRERRCVVLARRRRGLRRRLGRSDPRGLNTLAAVLAHPSDLPDSGVHLHLALRKLRLPARKRGLAEPQCLKSESKRTKLIN